MSDKKAIFKTGDIFLFHRNWDWDLFSDLVAWRIRKATHSYFNHIGILGDEGKNLYEIHLAGLRRKNSEAVFRDKKYNIVVLEYRNKEEINFKALEEFLKSEYEKRSKIKYDIGLIWKIRWALIRHGKINFQKTEGDDFYICSEFVQEAYKRAGVFLSKRLLYPSDFIGDKRFKIKAWNFKKSTK